MASQKFYKVLMIPLLFFLAVVFMVPVQADDEGALPPNPSPYGPNNKNQDKKKECDESVGSTASFCAGNLSTDYALPSYRSLGISRSLRFVYNSTAADVRPIIRANVDPTGRLRPVTLSTLLRVGGRPIGNEIFYNAAAFSAPSQVAVQFDANNLATGLYRYVMRLNYNYANSTVFEEFSDQVLVNNQRSSPFGVGWTLEGLQRLAFNGNSIILEEGEGSAKVFPRNLPSSLFAAGMDWETGRDPRSVAVGDFNGDRNLDLAVANSGFGSNNVSILLGNGDGTFQAARNFGVGNAPQSVAVGDFDGDGNLDLVVANSGSNNVSILLGNGDGTFQSAQNFPAGRGPWSVAVGDFNGDGNLDLAVANNSSNNVSILLGNGDGTFRPHPNSPFMVGSSPQSVVVGDFDGDGNPDLAVANGLSNNVSILLGNGDGTFQPAQPFPVGSRPQSVAVGDFDGDGNLDLAVANLSSNNVSILLGNGDGTFQPARNLTVGGPRSVAVGDFNGDGNLDLAVANSNGVSILLGNGDETFQAARNFTAGEGPSSVAVGDFEGDGNLDLAVANEVSNNVSILLGNGDGTFGLTGFGAGRSPESVAVGDFNGDGNLDLAVANEGNNVLSILLGNGDGTFQAARNFGVGNAPHSVAVGDFNGDGNLDLAVANLFSSNVSILLGHGDGTFQAARNLDVGLAPRSVVVGDFNGDRNLDLAVANQGGYVSILLGNGDGSFQPARNFAAGSDPWSVAVGDFDGDGNLDLAVANFSSNVSILLGNGDGSFQMARNFEAGSYLQSVAVGDFNGDGNLDLAVANLLSSNVSILLGNGDGSFQPARNFAAGSHPQSVAVGDFNGDGNLDLAVANGRSNNVSILLGKGDGMFQAARNFRAGSDPRSVAVGDFDGDGKPDLAVANGGYLDGEAMVSLLLSPRRSPLGEYSELVTNKKDRPDGRPGDGTYTRRMKDGTQVHFDSDGKMTSIQDRNQNTTEYRYDEAGKLDRLIDPVGKVTRFQYTASAECRLETGRGFCVIDPAGRVTTFNLDANGNLKSVKDPTSATVEYTYDSNHRLISQKDRRGNTTRYEYNFAGRFSRSRRMMRDEEDRLVEVTNEVVAAQTAGLVDPASGRGTRENPAPLIRLSDIRSSSTDGRGNVTTRTTGRFGEETLTRDALGRETKTLRDGNGNRTRIIVANGAETLMSYDHRGHLIRSVTSPDNRVRYVTEFTYHPEFNDILSKKDPKGYVTRFEYDDVQPCGTSNRGNLCKVIDPSGNVTELRYDSRGLLTETRTRVEGRDLVARSEYYPDGNLWKTIDPLGRVTERTYDVAGNVRTIRDAEGRVTEFEYDAMGRVTRTRDALGGEILYRYEPGCCGGSSGLLSEIQDARGKISKFRYDEVGRLREIENPLGQIRKYRYDKVGNLARLINARNQEIKFTYDQANQLENKEVPGEGVTCYSYDRVGNLTSVKKSERACTEPVPRNGLEFAYDFLNRTVRMSTLANSDGQPVRTITYGYDENSLRIRMQDQEDVTTYEYDELNRLISLLNPAKQETQFEYDEIGRRKRMTLPNQVVADYQYDEADQLRRLTYAGQAGEIARFNYEEYDQVGNRKVIRESPGDIVHQYDYDGRYRLERAMHEGQPVNPPERYAYDLVGNRLESHVREGRSCFDDANRLVHDGRYGYEYDADGNLSRKCLAAAPPAGNCSPTWRPTCSGEMTEYSFGAENLLKEIQLPDGTRASFKYDGLMRRIESQAGGETRRYLYDDGAGMLQIYDGNNDLVARMTQGPRIDEPISLDQDGESYFYILDGVGSVKEITDTAGNVLQSYIYDAFGRVLPPAGPVSQPFTYTAREWDAATGLYYYRARYYDPQVGRFISEDPIGFAQGINFYTYVGNNPLRFIDPLGLKAGETCWNIQLRRDPDGHWWTELGKNESYGWYPRPGVGEPPPLLSLKALGNIWGALFVGVPGSINQNGPSSRRDPTSLKPPPGTETLIPIISSSEGCKCWTCAMAENCIRNFARNYSGSWSLCGRNLPWAAPNCRTFQEDLMMACCLEF